MPLSTLKLPGPCIREPRSPADAAVASSDSDRLQPPPSVNCGVWIRRFSKLPEKTAAACQGRRLSFFAAGEHVCAFETRLVSINPAATNT